MLGQNQNESGNIATPKRIGLAGVAYRGRGVPITWRRVKYPKSNAIARSANRDCPSILRFVIGHHARKNPARLNRTTGQ